MTTEGKLNERAGFDRNLASTLFGSLVELAEKSTLAHAEQDDADARKAKVALGKQANTLKQALISLSDQAAQLPHGELSLDDQDWVIAQLEKELVQKRAALDKLKNAIAPSLKSDAPSDANGHAMETD